MFFDFVQIAGREQGSVESRNASEQHGQIANKGAEDFKEGVANLLNGKKTT